MVQQGQYFRISEVVSNSFSPQVDLSIVSDDRWEFMVPYGDQHGDPLWVSIVCQGQEVSLNDGGAISGQLFSLGQEDTGSPAFKLLESLAQRHGLTIDRGLGLVQKSCPLDRLGETLPPFVRLVLTVLTAAPHLESKPRRRHALGRRLRSRVRESCQKIDVFHRINRTGYLQGSHMSMWSTDFHWQLSIESARGVFVLAPDLHTQNPIQKAERVATLALDTRLDRSNHDLRVVIATEDLVLDEALSAAEIIKEHKQELDYRVFDYSNETEWELFLDQASSELLSEPAREWRTAFDKPEREHGLISQTKTLPASG